MKIQNVNFIWQELNLASYAFIQLLWTSLLQCPKLISYFRENTKFGGSCGVVVWRGTPLCRIHWLMYSNLNKKLWLYFGLNPCLLSLFYKEIGICEWKIPHKSLLAIGLPGWESIFNVPVDCRSPLSSAVFMHQRAWLCLHHSWPLYTLIFRKLS